MNNIKTCSKCGAEALQLRCAVDATVFGGYDCSHFRACPTCGSRETDPNDRATSGPRNDVAVVDRGPRMTSAALDSMIAGKTRPLEWPRSKAAALDLIRELQQEYEIVVDLPQLSFESATRLVKNICREYLITADVLFDLSLAAPEPGEQQAVQEAAPPTVQQPAPASSDTGRAAARGPATPASAMTTIVLPAPPPPAALAAATTTVQPSAPTERGGGGGGGRGRRGG